MSKITDRAALDAITAELRAPDWNADTLDAIAAIVRETGRDYSAPPATPAPARPTLAADTSMMSEAELRKHYKRTDKIETLKFWAAVALRTAERGGSRFSHRQAIAQGLAALLATVQNVTTTPASFDRQFESLKADWRHAMIELEREERIAAGWTYSGDHWHEPAPELAEPMDLIVLDAATIDALAIEAAS